MKVTDDFVLFWDGPFSQWYTSVFTIADKTYNCAEQYMMYSKAILFDDDYAAKQILNTDDPRRQKQLGRLVKNFDKKIWTKHAYGIVLMGNLGKFRDNAVLTKTLLDTGDRIIAEASPYDNIWGIGLSEDDPRCLDQQQWQGHNLLGKVLMEIRSFVQDIENLFRSKI